MKTMNIVLLSAIFAISASAEIRIVTHLNPASGATSENTYLQVRRSNNPANPTAVLGRINTMDGEATGGDMSSDPSASFGEEGDKGLIPELKYDVATDVFYATDANGVRTDITRHGKYYYSNFRNGKFASFFRNVFLNNGGTDEQATHAWRFVKKNVRISFDVTKSFSLDKDGERVENSTSVPVITIR